MDKKEELINKLMECQKQLMHSLGRFEVESWAGMDLTAAQLKSLFLIAHSRRANIKGVADALGVTPGNVTGVVERLVERGLVTRTVNPEDRRFMLLEVTEDGYEVITRLRGSQKKAMRRILSMLSEDELSKLYDGITALHRAADSLHPASENNLPHHLRPWHHPHRAVFHSRRTGFPPQP